MGDKPFKHLILRMGNVFSRKIRNFITYHVMGTIDNGLVPINPEFGPIFVNGKEVILDSLFESQRQFLAIEMQNTLMFQWLWNRFIFYNGVIENFQLQRGEKYIQTKPTNMIIFIRDYDRDTPGLVIKKSWADMQTGLKVDQTCQNLYIVQTKYIKEIIKERRTLSDFEAFVYYLYFNHLEGIEFEDKDGILKTMQEEQEKFIKEDKGMYLDMVREQIFAGTFAELMEESMKDKERMKEKYSLLEEEKNVINAKFNESEKERRADLVTLFNKFYPNEDSSFLETLSIKRYKDVFNAILNNEALQKIKAMCL